MPTTRGRVDLQPEQMRPINLNHYATKKSVAESMLDVALLMANASQMKAVLEQGPEFKYYITVLVLIGISLLFQVLAGALFVVMARKDLNNVANQRRKRGSTPNPTDNKHQRAQAVEDSTRVFRDGWLHHKP
ncbi:ninjurin-2 [Arapaima gigas]